MKSGLRGATVLVTGGTRGIGRAIGLAFGAQGARCVLTWRLGTADEDELRAAYAAAGAPEPRLVLADVSRAEDTQALLEEMRGWTDGVDIYVANAPGAVLAPTLGHWNERGLKQSLSYSAWPIFAYPRAIHTTFGRWPRYIVGMSSTGPDSWTQAYPMAAASKSVMETLARYLAHELRHERVNVNIVRSRAVRTQAFSDAFGQSFEPFAARFMGERQWVTPEDVANTTLALCSGRMDAINGQVLTLDRGTTWSDTLARFHLDPAEPR